MNKKVSHVRQDSLTQEITRTLTAYLKSQVIILATVTGVSALLLSLLKVKFALTLAVLTGSLSVVPVFGITIAACIAAIVAVLDGSRFLIGYPELFEGMSILLLFGGINIACDYILFPFLIGNTVHIHPLIILCTVIAGTMFFGIPGALLTVPVLIVAKTVSEHNARI